MSSSNSTSSTTSRRSLSRPRATSTSRCRCAASSPSSLPACPTDPDVPSFARPQRHEVQPDTYCRKLSLRVPLAVSVKRGELADLYHTIVRIAQHPCVLVISPSKRLVQLDDPSIRARRLSALPYGPDRSSASSLLGFPVTRTQFYVCASAGLTATLAVGVVWWMRAAARLHAATSGGSAGGGGGGGPGLLGWLGLRRA